MMSKQNIPVPASAHGISVPQRRESFLYRVDPLDLNIPSPGRSRKASLTTRDSDSEDTIVTPFAQLLSNLQNVKYNYMLLTNVSTNRCRRASAKEKESQNCSTELTDEEREELAESTLHELEWCLDQLESMQHHQSIGHMASHKFKKMLNRELSQFAESTISGHQVSQYISNTFVDKAEELDADLLKTISKIAVKRIQNSLPATVSYTEQKNISASDFPRYGIEIKQETELQQFFLENSLDRWGMDMFTVATLTDNKPLSVIAFRVMQERNLLSTFKIPIPVFLTYIGLVESHYRDTPYHNCIHAADVMQSSHVLLQASVLQEVLTDLEMFAVLLAAAIHDVDHPGVNNQFLINTESELALIYNDESVLENHHLAVAFKLLQQTGCDVLQNLPKDQRMLLRRMIISIVLATDMSKHFDHVAHLKTMVEACKVSGNNVLVLESYSDRVQVLQNLVHCADLGNPTKSLPLYQVWTDRLMNEQFLQGDMERQLNLDISPMCSRDNADISKSQIGFIDYIAYPLWETWSDLVHPHCQDILSALQLNKEHYIGQCEAEEAAAEATHTPPTESRKS